MDRFLSPLTGRRYDLEYVGWTGPHGEAWNHFALFAPHDEYHLAFSPGMRMAEVRARLEGLTEDIYFATNDDWLQALALPHDPLTATLEAEAVGAWLRQVGETHGGENLHARPLSSSYPRVIKALAARRPVPRCLADRQVRHYRLELEDNNDWYPREALLSFAGQWVQLRWDDNGKFETDPLTLNMALMRYWHKECGDVRRA